MPRGFGLTLRVVDGSMLLYWAIAALACARVVHLPADFMYAGYGTPMVDAWNWSFAPLDLTFSALGFVSLRLARRGDRRWIPLALISLALTFCAGLMAISFWGFRADFELSWWLPNLALMGIAVAWTPALVRRVAGNARDGSRS